MPTLKKLTGSYQYEPPLELNAQFALLWAYRRALAQVLTLERELESCMKEIGRLQAGREELSAMVQELIERLTVLEARAVRKS